MLQLYISNQKQTIYGLALFLDTTGIVCTELSCKVKVHKLGQSDGARSTSTTNHVRARIKPTFGRSAVYVSFFLAASELSEPSLHESSGYVAILHHIMFSI